MTFARVNTLGWALYEPLTSGQMNALDLDHVDAIDKVGGDEVHPTVDHINVSHPSGYGLRWEDPYWPLLEAREQLLWFPLFAISSLTDYLSGINPPGRYPVYYFLGADFINGGNAAPARPNSLWQAFVQNAPLTSQVPRVRWELTLPEACMLKGAGVRIYQPAASIGTIEQPPKVYVYTQSCTADGAEAALGNATASGTYNQTNTNLEATFTPANQDGKRIIVELRGEAGANAQAGMSVFGLFARVNVSELRY